MKVICINTSGHINPLVDKLVEGNTYEVIDDKMLFEMLHYIIFGHEFASDGTECAYVAADFVPISEIDETEMERNYNLQVS